MIPKQNLRNGLLFGSLAALGVASITGPVLAQEEAIEEIVTTGSRIARDPNVGAPVAVQSVTSEDIQLSGEIDVTEVVKTLPALLTTTSGEGSIDGTFAGDVGEAILQLRGMGTERTLVLVNGRRHVAGVAGSQAVDVNSIPSALVERVEVLTGGASAIYGADAVTGVVNFILRDDYEGLEFNAQAGLSADGDGGKYNLNGLWGKNFAGGKANFTVSVDYSTRDNILFGDRDEFRDNGYSRGQPNPALRFQNGDIGSSTPNFAQYFAVDNGFFPRGFRIPTADDFIADYTDAFGSAPTLTAAELALIDRAANAPTRAILPQPNFSISNQGGVVATGDFLYSGLDLDGNGTEDCLDSSVGFNSLLEDVNSFGIAGGCWLIEPGGNVRPYRDGLIAGVFNQFGPDGIADTFNPDYLLPKDDKLTINLMGRYDVSNSMTLFGEVKYSDQSTDWGGPLNTFYDLLTVAPDNPYIPPELLGLAQDRGGLFITRDPTDLGPNINTNERTVFRVVAGIEGEFANGWNYEFAANRGEFELKTLDRNRVIQDRWFAAIDVTTDASGNPACRNNVDPGAEYPTTIFGIPTWDFGYFTFNPGDGSCVPANILGGPGSISQAAVDWITTTTVDLYEIEQTVFSAIFDGELGFGLPAGDIAFAAGAEYRDEKSTSTFDPLDLGVLPVTTPDGNAGDLVRDLGFSQNALVFDGATLVNNSTGSYDVWEVFGEVEIPLLDGAPFARELRLNLAGRYSDYSTIGDTTTWNVGLSWAPVDDIRFRSTVSQAVRAPNIFELFEPEQGAFFRPIDPCDQTELDALAEAGNPVAAIREANCRSGAPSIGLPAIPEGYNDPLSARFSGVVSGNADLQEETADTLTVGFVLQPRFLDGLTLTVDYYDIDIQDAIASVGSQDIVDNCYDSENFPNQYCDLFSRNSDPSSAQFGGFTFLRQTQVNFGKITTKGIDFSVKYGWDMGGNSFEAGFTGTKVDNLDYYFDAGDPTAVDPELGEIQRPELAGNFHFQWMRGPFLARYLVHYQDEQGLGGVEIDTVDTTYGPAGIADSFTIHDLSFGYDFNDSLYFYGGLTNLTDEKPFVTEQAYPINPLGRYFFVGLNYKMQ
ncbi:MAG: TonB-dependent receptor [Gammaproteobacteria bacterium]|nr:TonB-dependent receptor [Gammaproteobacteria bacterium]MDH4254872.1 TonB-dependent receptor [Gammaproteobacteria bacterium]MDH5310595.1 TonB-dependent receptor [Gammaproteobacteria bacterium]